MESDAQEADERSASCGAIGAGGASDDSCRCDARPDSRRPSRNTCGASPLRTKLEHGRARRYMIATTTYGQPVL